MINLVPPEIKKRYATQLRAQKLVVLYGMVIGALLLIVVSLYIYSLSQQSTISSTQTDIDNLKSSQKRSSAIASKAAFIDDRLKQAPTDAESQQWSQLINLIAQSTPVNIQLTDLKINITSDKGTVISLTGQATSRSDILLMKEKLASETEFIAPTIQSMNDITNSSAISFIIQTTYNKNVGKK